MSRFLTTVLVAGLGAAVGPIVGPFARPATAGQVRSVQQGIYSNEQADRGQVLYHAVCESCHAPDLAGGKVVPEIVGPTFIARWTGRTVGQFFERVVVSMPEADPSSVTRQDKVDIVAFVLRANGFPPGDVALADRLDDLDRIQFEIAEPAPERPAVKGTAR